MTNTITLTIDENNNIRKESKYPFDTHKEAKECYREGQLAIRKCAGSDVDEMVSRGNALRNLQENIETSLNKLKNSASECNINIIDIANDITKNLTVINERKRVGLLIDVNQSKMDDFEKEFKYLTNKFMKKCDCKKM